MSIVATDRTLIQDVTETAKLTAYNLVEFDAVQINPAVAESHGHSDGR